MKLKPAERETHFVMSGDNRQQWNVTTNDWYWQRRLDKVSDAIYETPDGSKHYILDANQVSIRSTPKQLTDEEKAARAERLKRP